MTQDYFPLKYMYKTVTSKFFFNKILEFSSSGFGVIRDDCHLLNATCCSRSSLDGGEAFFFKLTLTRVHSIPDTCYASNVM